jgi:hypothetical protein
MIDKRMYRKERATQISVAIAASLSWNREKEACKLNRIQPSTADIYDRLGVTSLLSSSSSNQGMQNKIDGATRRVVNRHKHDERTKSNSDDRHWQKKEGMLG